MQVIIYSLNDSDFSGFDEAILRAVFGASSGQRSLDLKLRQAMAWQRLDIAKAALSEASSAVRPVVSGACACVVRRGRGQKK